MIKAPITTVNIYLLVQTDDDEEEEEEEEEEEATEIDFTHAFSIPLENIKRLTLRPLKWLRFATFAVCGAKGHLSATRGGEAADYENMMFNDLTSTYYYTPDSAYNFIDIKVFNDPITSSAATPRCYRFRQDICDRDNTCVFTGSDPDDCDVAHIIPRSKGDNYITHIVHNRFILYDQLPFGSHETVYINCIQNGVFLRKDLHSSFGKARTVFLRTPNFAMEPGDVPQVDRGSIPHIQTTLQHMKRPMGRDAVPHRDVEADWSNESAPPSILLDFMYGAAVAQHWMSDELCAKLDQWHEEIFSKIPKHRQRSAPEDSEDDDAEVADQGDPPAGPSKRHIEEGRYNLRRKNPSDASPALDAMDRILLLSMVVAGRTPRRIIAEMEKQEKENELRSQAHSVEKVKHWLDSSHPS